MLAEACSVCELNVKLRGTYECDQPSVCSCNLAPFKCAKLVFLNLLIFLRT